MAAHDSDVLGDVNQHTNGTEFYGTSSNYVLLNQLFLYARLHLPPGRAGPRSLMDVSGLPSNGRPALGHLAPGSNHSSAGGLATGTLSVVNLLSSEEALLAPSRDKTPPCVVERDQSSAQHDMTQSCPSTCPDPSNHGHHTDSSMMPLESMRNHCRSCNVPRHESTPTASIRLAERRLETELVRGFLHNLHHLHPMLDTTVFLARCEEEMWKPDVSSHGKSRDRRHFVALYNIVVAVGALVAGADTMEELSREVKMLEQNWHHGLECPLKGALQRLSRHYFRKSRASLGDVFEACSLESAQTLLLMVYRRLFPLPTTFKH